MAFFVNECKEEVRQLLDTRGMLVNYRVSGKIKAATKEHKIAIRAFLGHDQVLEQRLPLPRLLLFILYVLEEM